MKNDLSSTNLKAISLRLPEHIHQWLTELSAKEKRSINSQVVLMFEQLYAQAQKGAQPSPPATDS